MADDFVEHFLLLFLLDRGLRSIARRLRWSKRTGSRVADQDMTRVNLLFRLTVFCFRLALFELDDVVTKLALHDVADLSGLQCKSGLLKLRHHVAVSEPTEIAALVFTAVSRVLLRQLREVLAGTRTLQNFLRLRAVLLVGVELRMARKVSINLSVGCLHLVFQRILRVFRRDRSRVL